MANSRLPRFILEVAPPQFVTVMRHRTIKMLDPINEEDNDSLSPTSKSSPTSIPAGATAATTTTAAAASSSSSSPSPSSSSSASTVMTDSSMYFHKGASGTFSIFND